MMNNDGLFIRVISIDLRSLRTNRYCVRIYPYVSHSNHSNHSNDVYHTNHRSEKINYHFRSLNYFYTNIWIILFYFFINSLFTYFCVF